VEQERVAHGEAIALGGVSITGTGAASPGSTRTVAVDEAPAPSATVSWAVKVPATV
jgi:hypothetical protein